MEHTQRDRFSAGLSCALLVVLSVSDGRVSARPAEQPESVLAKMAAMRRKVENFQCTVKYHDFGPNPSQGLTRALEQLKENGETKPLLERLRDMRHTFQEHRLAFDSEGRARVELLAGSANPDGTLAAVERTGVCTWDGETSIEYFRRAEKEHGAAMLGAEPRTLAAPFHRQPWSQFGGNFVRSYEGALAQGSIVTTKMQSDGKYRITIEHGGGRSEIAVIDPEQGYSATVQEAYRDNKLTRRYTARFREVAPNVWFPVRGEAQLYDLSDRPQIRLRSTVEVDHIKVNDPNFYDGLFHVDLPRGTAVVDAISGLRYRVGEPMSERLLGSESTEELALEALEQIAKQTEEEVEIVIPRASRALKEGTPYVLNLSDSTLVNPHSAPDSQAANERLTELGKGDVAWDGRLMALRATTIQTTRQESGRPLRMTRGQWVQAYELAEGVRLPYWMIVVTPEGGSYLVSLRGIQEDQIRVTTRRLRADELSFYGREPDGGEKAQ
jgi:hypothetical protein